jgi:hypothetical protein
MSTKRSGFQALWLVLVLAGLAGAAWYGLGPDGWFRTKTAAPLAGAEVRRGPLRISVVERGNLKAADSVVMKSEIEGMTTILWLIEEGTLVEAGACVVWITRCAMACRPCRESTP